MQCNFFPFDTIRNGQEKFISAADDALKNNKTLLVHAPTGIGKTAASIAPALEFALKNNKKLFFLTTRNTHHKIAIETLVAIKKKKQLNQLIVLDMVGKKHLCKQNTLEIFSGNFANYCGLMKKTKQCLFYKNTYNSAHKLTQSAELFRNKIMADIYSSDQVKEKCNLFCPYEIQTEVAKYADVIIGDYFHLFDENVFSSVFGKSGIKKQDIILIADEAHNLQKRIKSIYSINLSSKSIKKIIEVCQKLKDNYLANIFSQLYSLLLTETERLSKFRGQNKTDFAISRDFLINIIEESAGCSIQEFGLLVEKLGLLEIQNDENSQYLLNFADFIKKWQIDKDGFLHYASLKKDRELFFQYKKQCLDPGIFSGRIFSKLHCSILMSATLTPFEMQMSVLGIKDNCECLKLPSPFPKKNQIVIIANNVTTKYTQRDSKSYQAIADYIVSISKSTQGNIAVFFPSYEYMNNVLFYVQEDGFCLLAEQQNTTKKQKEHLYNLFKRASYIPPFAVLAAVVGANFSEGVDFPGDIVKTVCIVGIPFEKKTIETDATIDYYNKKFNNHGWDFGYINPAINKTIQAAGRCIRSEKDIGAICLLDCRYLTNKYRCLLPNNWNDAKIVSSNKQIQEELEKFFRG